MNTDLVREQSERAAREYSDAVQTRESLKTRLAELSREFSVVASERKTLTAKLAKGDDGCNAGIDANEQRQKELTRQIEGVETLLSDAEQLVTLLHKEREKALKALQRAQASSGFDTAKARASEAFEKLRANYENACTALAEFALQLDQMDGLADQLGEPQYHAIRQSLLTETLNPPYSTLLHRLRASGHRDKRGGWGENWRLEVIPLFAPSQNGTKG